MTGVTDSCATEILAVDDNAANLLAFEAVLGSLGVPVVQLRSGEEALHHILRRGHAIAVMLLDVHMPGLDGFETAHLIRSRESLRHLPIIFVSAVRREEAHIVKGYAEGAVDYVVKPFNPESLRAKVAFFVEAHRRAAELGRARLLTEERLALALAASNMGVWDWDPSDAEVRCDDRCRALLELPEGASISSLESLGLPPLADFHEGQVINGEVTTDSSRCLRTQARVYRLDRDLHVVGVVADITEDRQNERERELFVGVLGHDLRNPLGAVSLQSHLLARHDDASVRTAAQRILRSSERMAALIDDMLEFAGSRSGVLSLSLRPTSLDDICRDVVEDIRAVYPEHVIEVVPGNPRGGVWDVARIAQVVQNLTTNAIRHSENGAPVRIVVREETGPDDVVVLEVHNAGPPIPEELGERMFSPFVSGAGSVGLGLFISRRLIEAHAGHLDYVSDAGQTTFRVALPRKSQDANPA